MTQPTYIQQFVDKLLPQQEFAGLDVGEKLISYLLLSRYDLSVRQFAEVPLAPGTVAKGEIKNSAAFIQALRTLQETIHCRNNACLPFIVSLPSANFFLNVLELPDIPEASYEQAVKLNIGQVSPIPIANAYMDWQNLGVNLKTLQREFLIAVASRQRIDPYLDAFHQAQLQPFAIESRSLSLLRLFTYFSQTVEKNVTLLIIDVGQDGITFLVGKQGKLFFDSYVYWNEIPEAQDGTITQDDLQAIMQREVRRILEFYSLHTEETVHNFSIFSPVLKSELTEYIMKTFSIRYIPVALPDIKESIQKQSSPNKSDSTILTGSSSSVDLYAGLIGLSVRGSLVPREDDDIVSVMPEHTREIYKSTRMYSFVSLWTKIVCATLGGLCILAAAVYGMTLRERLAAQQSLDTFNKMPEIGRVTQLEQEAKDFNALVDTLDIVSKRTHGWSPYMDWIVSASRTAGITITRMSLSENASDIRIWGKALNQQAAFNFRSAIEQGATLFGKIDLPLSSFAQTQQGVEFMLTAALK